MSDRWHTQQPAPTADPAERLAQHLLSYPSDLVDTHRLLRQFQASADDFQRALTLIDRRADQDTPQ